MKLRYFLFCIALLAYKALPAQTPVIRTDVPNKAYFKDLFVDSGIEIVEHTDFPAADMIGLSQETMRLGNDVPDTVLIQRSIFCGTPEDLNGRLLYPDGQPRFKCLYMYGGLSNNHGLSLSADGRETFRIFYNNGGSYVGSCAGAYIASIGYNGQIFRPGYIGLWPGIVDEARIEDIYPTYFIPEQSPLRSYGNFGGDYRVDGIEHWNGPFFTGWRTVKGTELLAINELDGSILDGRPSLIARKADCNTGRLVISGGHPEISEDPEQKELMAAILKYAIDGRGCAKVKGVLQNGKVRKMVKSTSDNNPDYTMVGDLQCHNFVFALPSKARNIKVRLEVLTDHNLSLRLADGTFAFREDADYSVENKDLVKELYFEKLSPGTWYVGVQCEDTVTVIPGRADKYENTDVLNGVPYTISVTWDTVKIGEAELMCGADINEAVKKLASADDFTRVSAKDSTITSISFRTKCRKKGQVRIDAPGSEEPAWASYSHGAVTISTPAAKFTCGILSNIFNGMEALDEIRNFEAVDTKDCIAIPEFPKKSQE